MVEAFFNPFTVILIALATVSAFTDIILAKPGEADLMAVIIITTMVLVSGVIRFIQETRSGHAAENLLKMIRTTTNVRRWEDGNKEIPLEEVVVGDIVHIAAGDMIPADMRIIQAKDLFISQSAMTGESIAVEKIAEDGLLVRDGAHLKVKDCLTVDKYILWIATPDVLNISENTTPGVFAEKADSTFFDKFGIVLNEE